MKNGLAHRKKPEESWWRPVYNSRKILDQAQAASTAAFAESRIVARDSKKDLPPVLSLLRLPCRSRGAEQCSAPFQLSVSMAVGQESVVANAHDEPSRD